MNFPRSQNVANLFPSNTALLIVGLFFVALLGVWNFYGRRTPIVEQPSALAPEATSVPEITSPLPSTLPNDARLSGTISQVDMGCLADGVCRVLVNEIWIVLVQGSERIGNGQETPVGLILAADGITPAALDVLEVGKQVEVFANSVDTQTMSLYGKDSYYIKLLN